MVEIGSLDRITNIIGERGMGKSTKAINDAREFQRETGGFVIGHSPNGQIGWEDDIIFYDSIEELEEGLRKQPHMMHFIAHGATPEQVIDFADALSLALRKQGHKKAKKPFHPHRPAQPGVMAAPVLVIVDEGTHTDQSTRLRKKEADEPLTVAELKELEKFLTSARHKNIALTFLIQAPTSRGWVYLEQGNIFYVFRYSHEWGANAVRAAGIPKEEIPVIRTLERFRYLEFYKMYPLDARYRDLPLPS
jgi:hypothetical protein